MFYISAQIVPPKGITVFFPVFQFFCLLTIIGKPAHLTPLATR